MTARWRLGTRNPFTVYRVADGAHDVEHAREHFVGSFRREEDARLAVDAVNAQAGEQGPVGLDDLFTPIVGWAVVRPDGTVRDFVMETQPPAPTWYDLVLGALEGDEVRGLSLGAPPRRDDRGDPIPVTGEPAEPTTPPACDCPDTDGAEPAGSADDEWVDDPSRSDHPVYECNLDHWCAMCGDPAAHKVGEEAPTRVPDNTNDVMIAAGHNLTNWLCCLHFRSVIGDCGDRRTGDDQVNAPRDDPDRTRLAAGSAVGQRGAPTRDVLVEAFKRAEVVLGPPGAAHFAEPKFGCPSEREAERMADVALAALRDGGADTGGEDEDVASARRDPTGAVARTRAKVMEARARVFAPEDDEAPEFRDDLADAVMDIFGPMMANSARMTWLDGEELTRTRALLRTAAAQERVAVKARAADLARLATALSVSLDPDDPDPVGRLVEAAGKAREVEVVSGAEAADLPVGSIVVRDYTEHDYVQWGWKLPSTRFPMTKTPEGFREHVHDHRPDELASNFRFRVLYRAPAPAPAALAVGDEVTTAEQLETLSVGTALRDRQGDVVKVGIATGQGPQLWAAGDPEVLNWRAVLPARVIDLPAVRVGTGGGES